MQKEPKATRQESNAYELFILVLTVLSLVFMAGLVLPRLDPATESLLRTYDNAICLVFLFDFGLRLKRASSKRGYLVGGGGWLDLLGSIPSFGGALRFTPCSGWPDSAGSPGSPGSCAGRTDANS